MEACAKIQETKKYIFYIKKDTIMKEKHSPHLSLLTMLLLLSLFAFFQFTEDEYRYISMAILLFSVLAMHVLSSSKNFIWLLVIIFGVGFGLLFITDSSLEVQLFLIKQYSLLIVAVILIWLLFSETKKVDAKIQTVQQHANTLEKYVGSTHLLTYREFVNRVEMISTGTQRRGEENFYLHFQLQGSEITKASFEYLFTETLLRTIRKRFDLATQLENGTYLVFLQHTQREGCTIVMNRFIESLKKQLDIDPLPFKVDILNEAEATFFMMPSEEGAK